MAEKELTTFLILVNVVLLVFVGGILAFVMLYRQRKIQYQRETQLLQQLHEQNLVETQLEVQKQTMRDIGREIHDNVGQKLTLASIYVQGMLHAKQYPQLENQITDVHKIIDDSLHDLRQISKYLVQPELAQKTLFELLERERLQINQTGLCEVKLKVVPPQLSFDISVKNNLFRLAQEFIQNSLKHARCQYIELCIKQQQQEGIVLFYFFDNGTGFDIDQTMTGIGLFNMKRRINELQAFDYEFTSVLGKGTSLKFSLKL